MRALRLHAPGDLRMHDEPIPQPGPGEALIQVRSVGVCASDVHWWRDGGIGTTVLTDPVVLGHEASGTVVEVGEPAASTGRDVRSRSTDIKPGLRVAIEPARPCLACEFCAAGNFNVCPSVLFFGTPPTDGCFRDYVVWPTSLLLPAPDKLSMDEIAMVEPLAIGIYAVDLAEVRPGETVGVLGAGAIGLSVVQALRLAGAGRILVSEPVADRRELAAKLGADVVCDPVDLQAAAADVTSGRGLDLVFECAGEPDAVRETSKIARVLGRVMITGIPRGDDYPFDASTSRRKQITAVFVRRSNLTTERAMELTAAGKVDVLSYVTHTFPLERAGEAIELAESKSQGVLRAVVKVSEEGRGARSEA